MYRSECVVAMEDACGSNNESSKELFDFDGYSAKYVSTECGYLHVAHSQELGQFPSSKPVLLTFHDVGFNFRSNFESFFANTKMRFILRRFNLLHVNAPGQELFAKMMFASSDDQLGYPSLDQIANGIHQVVQHFGVNEFVGFGVSY